MNGRMRTRKAAERIWRRSMRTLLGSGCFVYSTSIKKMLAHDLNHSGIPSCYASRYIFGFLYLFFSFRVSICFDLRYRLQPRRGGLTTKGAEQLRQ